MLEFRTSLPGPNKISARSRRNSPTFHQASSKIMYTAILIFARAHLQFILNVANAYMDAQLEILLYAICQATHDNFKGIGGEEGAISRSLVPESRSLNGVRMQANHRSGTPTCISDEILLFGLARRTTCRAGNFRGRLMAPLCKTWRNYTQLLELSFSSPHLSRLSHSPPLSSFSQSSVSLHSFEKILCRRFSFFLSSFFFFFFFLLRQNSRVLSLSFILLPLCRIHPEKRPCRSDVESSCRTRSS